MNRIIIASTVLLANFAGQAMAACPTSGRLTASQILTLLGPSQSPTIYACGSAVTPTAGFQQWNEYLVGRISVGPVTSGAVWDYKKGPGSTVEPSEQVGTYTVVGGSGLSSNLITYNYGTGGTYTYGVYGAAPVPPAPPLGTYTFCSPTGSPSYTITVSTDPRACGFPSP